MFMSFSNFFDMSFLDCHLILNKRGCYNIGNVCSYHLCINHFGIT